MGAAAKLAYISKCETIAKNGEITLRLIFIVVALQNCTNLVFYYNTRWIKIS